MPPTTHNNGLVAALPHQRPGPGTVIRIARAAAGWSQAELGHRCGYSASQVSRWETGRLPLRDVMTLRTLADVLDLPPEVFGLASHDMNPSGSRRCARASPPLSGNSPIASTLRWPADCRH